MLFHIEIGPIAGIAAGASIFLTALVRAFRRP